MVPKHNAPGHLPAYTPFRGRTPSYKTDTPHAFGTTGFLQRAQGPLSNTAAPRADYCLWLGTTRNLEGTHRSFSLGTFTEITGDTFRPAPLTADAINRLRILTTAPCPEQNVIDIPEPPLSFPDSPYALDPNRGVEEDDDQSSQALPVLVRADTAVIVPLDELGLAELNELGSIAAAEPTLQDEVVREREHEQTADIDTAEEVSQMRNEMNLRKATTYGSLQMFNMSTLQYTLRQQLQRTEIL